MLVLFKCSGKTGQTTPSHWKSKYENAILQTSCSSRFIFWGCGLMTFLFRGGGSFSSLVSLYVKSHFKACHVFFKHSVPSQAAKLHLTTCCPTKLPLTWLLPKNSNNSSVTFTKGITQQIACWKAVLSSKKGAMVWGILGASQETSRNLGKKTVS